jgi:serine/threonine-protein kinase HipA
MIDPRSLTVSLYGRMVGRLMQQSEGLCVFQYDPAYAATGMSISPLALPVTTEVMVAKPEPFRGTFGVFDDSLPDGWGQLLQARLLIIKHCSPSRGD